jgi:NIMA (never in mitosis gene a)-related kinase 1/4/5
MEYADGGDAFQLLKKHQEEETYLSEIEIWNILIQVTQGLNQLHQMNIMHRDLKSANVFLNSSGEVKLGDLNVSKVLKSGLSYTQTGTPYYASPEVWKDMPYDTKSDIWSFGCVIYEIT